MAGLWLPLQNLTLTAEFTDDAARNWRNVLPASLSLYSGTKIRVTFAASAGKDFVVGGASIGVSASGDDFDATPTRITWGGGNHGITITAGNTAVSDEISFTFEKANRHLLEIYTSKRNAKNNAAGSTSYSNASGVVDDTMTQTVNYGSSAANWYAAPLMEVYQPYAAIYDMTSTGRKGAYGYGQIGAILPTDGSELSSANYTAVATENGADFSSVCSVNNQSPYHIYRATVGESGISQYTGYAKGHGATSTSVYSYKLYIWNFNSTSWEQLGTPYYGGSDSSVTASKTANLSYYKEPGANYVYLMTFGPSAPVMESATLYDDYEKLIVTYSPASAPVFRRPLFMRAGSRGVCN